MQHFGTERSGSGTSTRPPEQVEMIGELFQAILRQFRLVLFVAMALVAMVYVIMQAKSDSYEVEARLLVKVGPENVELPSTVSNGAMISSGVRKEDINSDVILLQSRHLIEQAVDSLGVEAFKVERPRPTTLIGWLRRGASVTVRGVADGIEAVLIALRLTEKLSERDEIVLKLADDLVVMREGESDVIFLSLELGNADLGVKVLDLMIDRFLTDRTQTRRTPGTQEFFEEQVAQGKAALQAADRDLNDLRRTYRLTSIGEERRLLLERSSKVRYDIIEAEQARDSAKPLQGLVASADPARMDGSFGGATFRDVRDNISAMMVQRTANIGQFSASGKAARELDEKIGALLLLLDRAVAQEIEKRQSELSQIETRLEELNEAEQALELLTAERKTLQTRFDDQSARLEQERINARMQDARLANVAVLSAPSAPIEPSGPARLMTSLVSLPLGLVLGMFLAGALFYADPRLRSARDAGRIPGLTVLGEMPRQPEKG